MFQVLLCLLKSLDPSLPWKGKFFLYLVGAEYMMECRYLWDLRVVHNDPMSSLSALFLNSSW